MPDVNPDFVRIAREQRWHSDELMERIAEEGHIHFDEVPEEIQRVFVTSHDITPEWHVRMQGAFQEHTDSAISKTTNFSFEANEEDVRKIYELAFRLGCKGVTVYRDGSRPEQVLSTGKTAKGEESVEAAQERIELEEALADAREDAHRLRIEIGHLEDAAADRDATAAATRRKRQRPGILAGRTVKMNSPLGDLYVTINEDEHGRAFEVFCTLGKAGGPAMADAPAQDTMRALAGKRRPAAYGPPSPRSSGSCHIGILSDLGCPLIRPIRRSRGARVRSTPSACGVATAASPPNGESRR